MTKVILKGSQQCQWNIGGSMKPGSVPIEFTDKEIKEHKGIISEIIDGPKVIDEVKDKKYTEKELFAMNKAEQVELINKLTTTPPPRLEKDRVKLILEVQK